MLIACFFSAVRGRNLRTAFFMATADEIATAAALNAASGISSHANDGTQTTALDPMKQLDVADRLAAREVQATLRNRNGGFFGITHRVIPGRGAG